MLEHGTWACRSAGCCCADCAATESARAMEDRMIERRWMGDVRPSLAKLIRSAAADAYVYWSPGRGKPGIVEEVR